MKINFNENTSITYKKYSGKAIPNWLFALMQNFYESHDIYFEGLYTDRVFKEPKGIKIFSEWLKKVGYIAEYWEWDLDHCNR